MHLRNQMVQTSVNMILHGIVEVEKQKKEHEPNLAQIPLPDFGTLFY